MKMKQSSKYNALLKDTFIFAIGSVGSKIIQFFLVPLYTAFLSTEEYGISNLVFTIGQLLIPILSLEVFDGVLRFGLSKDFNKEDVIYNAFIVIFFDFAISFILYPFLSIYKPIKEWRVYLLLYLLLSIINITTLNYLKVCNKNKTYALISLLQTLVLCVSNIICIAYLKTGIRGYLLSNIIALFIASTISLFCGHVGAAFSKGRLNILLLKKMLLFSSPLILNSIAWWLISSSDKIMIERMVGSADLGIYSVAAKIPALVNVIISIFQQAWGISTIREIETTKDTAFFSNTFRIYSSLVFGACIIFLSAIRTFMRLYIGSNNDFIIASNYVPFLLVSAVFSAISTFYGSLYSALKKTNQIMMTTMAAGVVNIIVNYLAIRSIGTMGAVIGTLVAYVLTSAIRIYDMRRYLSIDVNWFQFILNCTLLFGFAFFVTISNADNLFASFIALALFIVINYKDIKMGFTKKRGLK